MDRYTALVFSFFLLVFLGMFSVSDWFFSATGGPMVVSDRAPINIIGGATQTSTTITTTTLAYQTTTTFAGSENYQTTTTAAGGTVQTTTTAYTTTTTLSSGTYQTTTTTLYLGSYQTTTSTLYAGNYQTTTTISNAGTYQTTTTLFSGNYQTTTTTFYSGDYQTSTTIRTGGSGNGGGSSGGTYTAPVQQATASAEEESDSATLLQMAKSQYAQGDIEGAKQDLIIILTEYPNTVAANLAWGFIGNKELKVVLPKKQSSLNEAAEQNQQTTTSIAAVQSPSSVGGYSLPTSIITAILAALISVFIYERFARKEVSPEIWELKTIRSYLEKGIKKGHSIESMKKALLKQNVHEDQIDSVLKDLRKF
jgi:hypothetical protein